MKKRIDIKVVLKRLMAFLGMPLIFVVLGYLLLYFIAAPVIAPVSAVADMIIGSSVPIFDVEHTTDEVVNLVEIGDSQSVVSCDDIVFPNDGDIYGHLSIPGTGVDCDVIYGDSNKNMRKGAGQYNASKLPGFGSTTLLCAHVTTHFKGLQYVKEGDIIYFNTTYGAYEYKVNKIEIVEAKKAHKLIDLRATNDNLILYTCYPFHAVAFRSQRYFVFAEKVSGPTVQFRE